MNDVLNSCIMVFCILWLLGVIVWLTYMISFM